MGSFSRMQCWMEELETYRMHWIPTTRSRQPYLTFGNIPVLLLFTSSFIISTFAFLDFRVFFDSISRFSLSRFPLDRFSLYAYFRNRNGSPLQRITRRLQYWPMQRKEKRKNEKVNRNISSSSCWRSPSRHSWFHIFRQVCFHFFTSRYFLKTRN